MRQQKLLTWTLLIPSIISFAFAAPAAVRERHEVRLDVNVTRNMSAMSQKRADSLDEGSTNVPGPDHVPPPSPDILSQMPHSDPLDWGGGSPNMPGLDHTQPPSPDLTDILLQIWQKDEQIQQMAEQHRYPNTPPPPSDSPGSLAGSDDVPSSLRSPTGFQTGQTGGSPLSPLPHPGPLEGPLPSLSGWAVNPGTASSTGRQPTLPQSPNGFPLPPLPRPGPSEDSFPPGFPMSPDTLSSTGSTGPHSPGVDPEIYSLLNPEPFPTAFWDKFWRGRIKRRISGSESQNLAQKDPRSRVF